MANNKDFEKDFKLPDTKALSEAYTEYLDSVTFGGKPIGEEKKKPEAVSMAKVDETEKSSTVHDEIVKKIVRKNKALSHSIWTDEPVLKPKKSVWLNTDDDNEETNALAKGLDENSVLTLDDVNGTQHFTQPPAHFTEASLVKALEEQGIGRPSTYAPTISTIIARHYVIKENKNLYISELGNAVNNIMMTAFPTIVDVKFTANMESLLDGVAQGTVEWKEIIRNFYPDLKGAIDEAEKELEHVKIEDEVTDVICDKCGRNMVIKYGPHGKFLGCPGFPECHNTKPYLEKIGVACPKCGKDVILKKTKKGRMFYGCEGYPECDFVSWQKPSDKKCPKCGGYMIEKGSKLVCADETCGYVESKNDKEQ